MFSYTHILICILHPYIPYILYIYIINNNTVYGHVYIECYSVHNNNTHIKYIAIEGNQNIQKLSQLNELENDRACRDDGGDVGVEQSSCPAQT